MFLYALGLTSAQVGIVVGASSALAVFIQPFIIGLIQRSKWLTMRKALLFVRLLTVAAYLLMAFIKIPVVVIMVLYIVIQTLYYSEPTFINEMGSSYIRQGYKIRFEIGRGIASGVYSVMSALIGMIVGGLVTDAQKTAVLGYLFLGFSVALAIVLFIMDEIPRSAAAPSREQGKKVSFGDFARANRALLLVAIGFFFLYAAFIVQITYAIDIVQQFGKNEADLGWLTFFWGLSEVPVMLGFSKLVKKVKCINLLKICAGAFLLKTAILAFAPSYGWVIVGCLLQSFSFGLWIPASVYYINNHVAHAFQPTGHSVIGIATIGAAGFAGNFLGGVLTGVYGVTPTLQLSCAVSLIGFVIVLCINSKKASTLNLLETDS